MEWNFRKEIPRHFEFPRQNPRRYAAVPPAPQGTRFAREPMWFRISPRAYGEMRIKFDTMRLQIVGVKCNALFPAQIRHDEIFYLLPQIE
jgi:hypothetical protein